MPSMKKMIDIAGKVEPNTANKVKEETLPSFCSRPEREKSFNFQIEVHCLPFIFNIGDSPIQ